MLNDKEQCTPLKRCRVKSGQSEKCGEESITPRGFSSLSQAGKPQGSVRELIRWKYAVV